MRNCFFYSAVFLTIYSLYSAAQTNPGNFNVEIAGKVVDSESNIPLAYASVILFNQSDSSKITGMITDDKGLFQLTNVAPGNYFIEISFMGFQKEILSDLRIKYNNAKIKVGNIKLKPAVLEGEEVEIVAEKKPIEYKIDRKVVNVDKQYTAVSGTAVDVLKNVPSVTTDIDGNVQLRGSTKFNLLIDGRPSPLDPSEAMEQIPASTVDRIEIITNPSAKYNPEGTSGIINIILKRNQLLGESGVINTNGSLQDKYGGDLLLSVKRGILTLNFGGNYNRRTMPGTLKEETLNYSSGDTTGIYSDGTSDRTFTGLGLRSELILEYTKNDRLGLGINFGRRKMDFRADNDYEESSLGMLETNYYSDLSESNHNGAFYSLNADFKHKFNKTNHELWGMITHNHRNMDEENITELTDTSGTLISGQKSTEGGPASRSEIQINYINPVAEGQKIETGYQMRRSNSDEKTGFYSFDTSAGSYVYYPEYSHNIYYLSNIHSLYGLYSREIGKIGYQLGLRTEYTYRNIELEDTGEKFHLERWDLYPSAHFSYELNKGFQFMTSYTRRVQQPREWFLEPFQTYINAYNIRQGNPNLQPEIVDSYEIGSQKTLYQGFVAADIYHRTTHNLIEQTKMADSANVTLNSVDNVGTSYASGIEMTIKQRLQKWWEADLIGTIYDYRIYGELFGEDIAEKSFNCNLRFNHSFTLTKNTKFQINTIYSSPSVTAQGEMKGFFVTDLALKREFFKKKLSATLQVNDVFATRKFDINKASAGLYTQTLMKREAQVVMLNLSYNLNNYKPEKKKEREGGNGDYEEEY
jgi:outer membrane receptor protein involved in Fe transport